MNNTSKTAKQYPDLSKIDNWHELSDWSPRKSQRADSSYGRALLASLVISITLLALAFLLKLILESDSLFSGSQVKMSDILLLALAFGWGWIIALLASQSIIEKIVHCRLSLVNTSFVLLLSLAVLSLASMAFNQLSVSLLIICYLLFSLILSAVLEIYLLKYHR